MIVSKATSVYVIMVVVLVGGLWLILALGSTLIPPPDLAGKWELQGDAGPRELSVEQSGRYVDLVMGSWSANLKVQKDEGQNSAQTGKVVMSGKGQQVIFEGLTLNNQCAIQFTGPMNGVFKAHRIFKTFR